MPRRIQIHIEYCMIDRRFLLKSAGIGAISLALPPAILAQPKNKKRVLVFTRSAGYQHDVVKITNGTCLVHETFKTLAADNDFEVECTKDGRVFYPETLDKFDAFFLFTTGDLTAENSADGSPPMPKTGKDALLRAVTSGKGFIGSHCASDTFLSPGDRRAAQNSADVDPYLRMLGGEFISHGPQQAAKMIVTDPAFPGVGGLMEFVVNEEWYSLKNFAPDLHVILVQETAGMTGEDYQRPRYPATWARQHGHGRVYYTSLGHRDDVWTNAQFRRMLVGAVNWTTGRVKAEIPPNLQQVAPHAAILPPPPKKTRQMNSKEPRCDSL